jgi:hypothetical protein
MPGGSAVTLERGLPDPRAIMALHEQVRLPLEIAVLLCTGEHRVFDRRWPRWTVPGTAPVWLLYGQVCGDQQFRQVFGFWYWEGGSQGYNQDEGGGRN